MPLPKLAQRIIKGLTRSHDDLLFPNSTSNGPMTPGTDLKEDIREKSGIADFTYHTCRDTVASWLQDQGHSEFERGLVLNHSESGVTSDYSHGYPVELKRALLEKWTTHVERLVQPEGAQLLR